MKLFTTLLFAPAVLAVANPDEDFFFYKTAISTATKQITNTKSAESLLLKLATDFQDYIDKVTTGDDWSSFSSKLEDVAPTVDPLRALLPQSAQIAATTTPSWWTKLPDAQQKFYNSVESSVAKIANKDVKDATGAAATIVSPALSAALLAAAGLVGGAAYLL